MDDGVVAGCDDFVGGTPRPNVPTIGCADKEGKNGRKESIE